MQVRIASGTVDLKLAIMCSSKGCELYQGHQCCVLWHEDSVFHVESISHSCLNHVSHDLGTSSVVPWIDA